MKAQKLPDFIHSHRTSGLHTWDLGFEFSALDSGSVYHFMLLCNLIHKSSYFILFGQHKTK